MQNRRGGEVPRLTSRWPRSRGDVGCMHTHKKQPRGAGSWVESHLLERTVCVRSHGAWCGVADGRRVSSSVEAGGGGGVLPWRPSEGCKKLVKEYALDTQSRSRHYHDKKEGEGDTRAGATVGLAHII